MIPDYIIDLDEYKEVQHIGSGAYGDVYLVEKIKMKKIYAAKIFRNEISSAKDQKIFFQGLITYSKVKHNSILSLQGFNMMNFDDEHKPMIKISSFFIVILTKLTTLHLKLMSNKS